MLDIIRDRLEKRYGKLPKEEYIHLIESNINARADYKLQLDLLDYKIKFLQQKLSEFQDDRNQINQVRR